MDESKIKIQPIPQTADGPTAVHHPIQIDVLVSWTDGHEPVVDELNFELHDTPVKLVRWGFTEDANDHSYTMGYCETCGVLFIIKKNPDENISQATIDWEFKVFKDLFRREQWFRDMILAAVV